MGRRLLNLRVGMTVKIKCIVSSSFNERTARIVERWFDNYLGEMWAVEVIGNPPLCRCSFQAGNLQPIRRLLNGA